MTWHRFEADDRVRVLDIGAGYGAFAEAVLDRFPNATAVGLDVSEPMMAVGRERMARFGDRFSYHAGDLEGGELPAGLPGPFDAVIASVCVLHLSSEARQRLYGCRISRPESWRLLVHNVEPVAPPNQEMQAWYPERRERQLRQGSDQPASRPEHSLMLHHHFESEDAFQEHQRHHHVDTEADQVARLRSAGFGRADCYYKQPLEAVICGYKPGEAP